MNTSQIMSQPKISTIPVETFLYGNILAPVALKTFNDFSEDHLLARRSSNRALGRGEEVESGEVFVWAPPKGWGGSTGYDRPRRKLFKVPTGLPTSRPVDVYEIRKEFFEIASPEAGLRLFTQYGIFGREHRIPFGIQVGLSFADLLQWQELIKACQLSEPSDWEALSKRYSRLRNVMDILVAPDLAIGLESPIRIQLFCGCVRDAVLAAIYLDKLANVKSSMCSRPDCGVVFNHESRHGRKFCSPDCAHLEAVRKSRFRKAGK